MALQKCLVWVGGKKSETLDQVTLRAVKSGQKSSQLPHTVPATACGAAPFIASQCAPWWLRAAVGDRSNKRTHTSVVAARADSSWPESTVTSRLSARALFWARVPRQEARYAAGASAWSSCQQHVSAYQHGFRCKAKRARSVVTVRGCQFLHW